MYVLLAEARGMNETSTFVRKQLFTFEQGTKPQIAPVWQLTENQFFCLYVQQ